MMKRIMLIATILIVLTLFSACSYFLPSGNKILTPELIESEQVIMPSMKIRKGDLIMMYDIEGTFIPEQTELFIGELTLNGVVKDIYYSIGESVKEGDLILELNTESILNKILVQEINVEKSKLSHEQTLVLFETGQTDKFSVQLSELTLESAENYLGDLKEELEKHFLFAPSGGVIVSMKFDVGDNAFGPAFKVSEIENGIVEVLINANADRLTPAQMALMDLDIGDMATVLYEGYEYPVELIRDASAYFLAFGFEEENTHTQFRMLELPENIGFNKRLTVRNVADEALDAVVIPMNAIYSADENPYTYILAENEIEKRMIELGMNDGHFYEVKSGLAEGEYILKIN